MSESVPVTIQVLEKEYVVSCPPGEEDRLRESARVLDERMMSAREAGKTLGTERVAVVTALNVIHEHLTMTREHQVHLEQIGADIGRLEQKLTESLGRRPDGD